MSSITQNPTAELQTDSYQTAHMLDEGFHIKVVEDMAEFMNLKEAWDGLLESKKTHVPFLCHDWFRIWLKHFLKGDKLFILLIYQGERLVAISPFVIKNEKYKGLMNVTKLELIGNVHSFIRNLIFGASSYQEKKTFVKLILNFLKSRFSDWDVLEFDSIPEEDELFMILTEVMDEMGLKRRQYVCFGECYLDGIDYSAETYMNNLSLNTRKSIGKKKRRMERIGNVDFSIGKDKEKLDHYLNYYEMVRKESWKHPEKDLPFLNELRENVIEKGCLVFGFVLFNEYPIAVMMAMISNKIAYLVETAYNLKYERYSPGEILHAEFFTYLIDEGGVKEIDTLKGDDSYKRSWTPQRRERKGITIFNKTLKGQTLGFLMTKALPVVQSQPYLMTAKNKVLKYLSRGHQ